MLQRSWTQRRMLWSLSVAETQQKLWGLVAWRRPYDGVQLMKALLLVSCNEGWATCNHTTCFTRTEFAAAPFANEVNGNGWVYCNYIKSELIFRIRAICLNTCLMPCRRWVTMDFNEQTDREYTEIVIESTAIFYRQRTQIRFNRLCYSWQETQQKDYYVSGFCVVSNGEVLEQLLDPTAQLLVSTESSSPRTTTTFRTKPHTNWRLRNLHSHYFIEFQGDNWTRNRPIKNRIRLNFNWDWTFVNIYKRWGCFPNNLSEMINISKN